MYCTPLNVTCTFTYNRKSSNVLLLPDCGALLNRLLSAFCFARSAIVFPPPVVVEEAGVLELHKSPKASFDFFGALEAGAIGAKDPPEEGRADWGAGARDELAMPNMLDGAGAEGGRAVVEVEFEPIMSKKLGLAAAGA